MNTAEENRFLSDLDVCKRYKISRSTLWRWIKNGHISAPLRIGPRAVRWSLSELIVWEQSKQK
ncbi:MULTISPECIES: helix-turn-helix transcriptional regulator [Halomonas]|uniref:helix-turn-helix transcriptional regulator n=1 Tax=Halomonas TaxID=2745 RepID=UPI0018667C91|nr:helix-turn-helix domain-containing protein [Halomonas colorata]